MYAQVVVFHQPHPPLVDKTAPHELARLHARQEVGLHLGTCAAAEARARGDIIDNDAEARIIVDTYLSHMNLTEGRPFETPRTETQMLALIRAAAAEIRIAYIEAMRLDPLTVDDDMALLVAIEDADLHSLIDHQAATGQLLVVRERIYGQPETAPGEMGE